MIARLFILNIHITTNTLFMTQVSVIYGYVCSTKMHRKFEGVADSPWMQHCVCMHSVRNKCSLLKG